MRPFVPMSRLVEHEGQVKFVDPKDGTKEANYAYGSWCSRNGFDGEINAFPYWLESLKDDELEALLKLEPGHLVIHKLVREELDKRSDKAILSDESTRSKVE